MLNRDKLADAGYEGLIVFQNPDYDEAVEFIEFNTVRALPYFGEAAPIIMTMLKDLY